MHDLGCMSWAKSHTPSGYLAFVVYRHIHNPNGAMTTKEHIVINLHSANKISEPDVYPLPTQDDILQLLQGKFFISVVDTHHMFHQWQVKKQHWNHIAVLLHRGQEIFNVTLMGYINSVPYIQRQMDFQLKEFTEFCRIYIDNIVIASKTFEDHLQHLNLLFTKLQALNITLEPSKSFLGYPSIQLLSFHVDAFGMTTLSEKTKAIEELKFPHTLADIERYLGLVGSLRHYIKNYAAKAAPLEERKALLLKGSPPKGQAQKNFMNKTLLQEPTTFELQAFETLQSEFTKPMFLVHYSWDCQLYVELDSSKESSHSAIAYHIHQHYKHEDLAKPPPRATIEPILFLSR